MRTGLQVNRVTVEPGNYTLAARLGGGEAWGEAWAGRTPPQKPLYGPGNGSVDWLLLVEAGQVFHVWDPWTLTCWLTLCGFSRRDPHKVRTTCPEVSTATGTRFPVASLCSHWFRLNVCVLFYQDNCEFVSLDAPLQEPGIQSPKPT